MPSGDAADTLAAQYFRQIVTAREPLEWVILRNGHHTPPALPSLLVWTWLAISGGPVATGTVQLGPATKGPLFGPPASVSSGPTREAPVV